MSLQTKIETKLSEALKSKDKKNVFYFEISGCGHKGHNDCQKN